MKSKIFINLISLVLVFILFTGTVFAENTDNLRDTTVGISPTADYAGTTVDEDTAGSAYPIATVTDEAGNDLAGFYEEFGVTAPAAVVMDMDSGEVLYGKNMYNTCYPASITKVMTALVAVNNSTPDVEVVFDEEIVYSIEAGSACAGMLIGEKITLDQCLRCMMAQSANECAYAVGKTVGGTMEHFLEMMNETAASLGCVNSHFANPHGLHDSQHYVCAYDMALIASAAYENEWFRDFCHLETYNRPLTEMNPDNDWVMYNRHQMFHPESQYYYEYVTGGKTGYTDQANTTLVTYAEKDGRRLVAVVLNCAGVEVYSSTRALFDYGFDSFTNYKASDIIDSTIIEELSEDFTITLPNGVQVTDIEQVLNTTDEKSASITFKYNGTELGSCDCILTDEYKKYLKDIHSEEIAEDEELTVDVEPENFVAENYKPDFILIGIFVFVGILIVVLVILSLRLKAKRKENLYSSKRPRTDNSDGDTKDAPLPNKGKEVVDGDNDRTYYRTSEDQPADGYSDAHSYYRSSDYDRKN